MLDPESVDIEDYLDCLSIDNVNQATLTEYSFSCPFPNHANGDQKASAYMNAETGLYFCHGCHASGSLVDFAARVLGVSPLEAIRMLKQRYQPGGINPDAVSMVESVKKIFADEEEEKSQPILDESILDEFAVNWNKAYEAYGFQHGHPACDYMFDRGFTPETLEEWEFGYHFATGRITIPVRNINGQLIGFKARAYLPTVPNKYLVLGGHPHYTFDRYYPSKVVFGANRVTNGEDLIVCEGELNAVAIHQKTGREAVAINGSHFTEFHARILRKIANSVVLFLDDDEAGNNAVWGWEDSKGFHRPGIVDELKNFMPVRIIGPHEKDAAELDSEQIEDLIENAESSLLKSIHVT